MLLTMLLTACQTSKVVTVEKVIIPELSFPIFPTDNQMKNNYDGTVTVTADWIVRLAEYKILIEETQNNYQQIKELYNDNK